MQIFLRILAVLAISLARMPSASAAETAATIISVQGDGAYSEAEPGPWRPAKTEQALSTGNFVRTAEYSRMGLLFRDRTQIRLNEKTRLRIKDAANETRLRIDIGRAWTQSKTLPNGLYMETPSATAAIRGTDWDIEVDANGRTMITVLSGEVDFFNEFGRVTVGKNEAAEAVIGKAPIKLLLVRPKDRVQWVTAFAIEPLRHITLSPEAPAQIGMAFAALQTGKTGEARKQFDQISAASSSEAELLVLGRIAAAILEERLGEAMAGLTALTREEKLSQPAAYLLLADLMLYAGEVDRAAVYLQDGMARFPQDARLYAAMARVHLVADEPEKSRAEVEQASQLDADSYEAALALGELARIEGDGPGAAKAFSGAIARKPEDDRAWFGMGRIHTEKEQVPQAKKKLLTALELNPEGPGYRGELGTLETFANNFGDARAAYMSALARRPDDYVALTGLGLLELKRGNTEAGLNAFLRASVIEPRFARAHVYIAVAYYQMELAARALEELRRASELDEKDPVPHLLASIIYNDLLRPAEAIEEARLAQQLMPNLKSLNQLANNQRGTTNLGQAFAFFGMEEWAQNYAQESYNQFWAGSHLFLADRYNGLFTKNSELFQGFLADPTAFGNSNRNQTLLQRPGNYFTGSMRGISADESVRGTSPLVQVNGFSNGVKPLAYFASQERFNLDLSDGPLDLTSSTVALGVAPRHDLGVFLFATNNLNKFGIEDTEVDLRVKRDTTNVDLGLHFKLSPTSQVWFKSAQFRSRDETRGLIFAFPVKALIKVRQPELALRHTFALGDQHEITWGGERAERKTASDFRTDFSDEEFPGTFSVSDLLFDETTYDLYLSDRWRPAPPLLLQADLFYQHQHRNSDSLKYPIFSDVPEFEFAAISDESISKHKIQPRLGLVYKFSQRALIRMAWQKWLRPAQFSSLGPVATVGIPLDDKFVERGGEMSRYRGQIEWEATPGNFITAHYDYKKGENNPFSQAPFTIARLDNLTRLSSRDLGSLVRGDLIDFSLPSEGAGRMWSSGLAVNHLLTRHWALFGRYVHSASNNTLAPFKGNDLPFLPEDAGAVGAAFIHPSGWYFVSRLVNRSSQFQDEANLVKNKSGWSGATDLYWQPKDKHWLFRASADDAFDRNGPTAYTGEITIRF